VLGAKEMGIERTIQVGDFGIGFAGPYWHERVDDLHSSGNYRFIRGNHDNPKKCQEMVGWIPDGFVENDVMFIGGAWSIDYAYRTEGVSWWRDEELSIVELNQLINVYGATKPRVMITHDCPTSIANKMFLTQTGRQYITRTAEALQAMIDIHQPEFYFFGHWHRTMQYKYGRTVFQCLDELDYVDIEL
jgi:hypothetical protein